MMTTSYELARKKGIKAIRTFRWNNSKNEWVLVKSKSKGRWS